MWLINALQMLQSCNRYIRDLKKKIYLFFRASAAYRDFCPKMVKTSLYVTSNASQMSS